MRTPDGVQPVAQPEPMRRLLADEPTLVCRTALSLFVGREFKSFSDGAGERGAELEAVRHVVLHRRVVARMAVLLEVQRDRGLSRRGARGSQIRSQSSTGIDRNSLEHRVTVLRGVRGGSQSAETRSAPALTKLAHEVSQR